MSTETVRIDPAFQALIPPLTTEEREGLERSLVAEGCRDPLAVWQGILLDGHNRHEICTMHEIPYRTIEVDLADRAAAQAWIIRNQFARRNLSAFARAELALKLKPLLAAEAHERMVAGKADPGQNSGQGRTGRELAKIAGVSHDTIARAETIVREADDQTKGKLRTGRDTINAVFNEIRRKERMHERVHETPPLPTGKYRVIYADPPWPYQTFQHSGFAQATTLDTHYPSMTLEDICALPVRDMADKNSVLFLWIPSCQIPKAVPVIDAWGFDYKTSIVWVKDIGNVGSYVHGRHEMLLIAARGSYLPEFRGHHDSVVEAPRAGHSVKPERFRELIDSMYVPPDGWVDRVELFARGGLPAWWHGWGNEAAEAAS